MKIGYFLIIIFTASCSTSPNHNNKIDADVILDENKQQEYYQEWQTITADIDRVNNKFHGQKVDIWGGGALALDFWFQDSNLWDSMVNVDDKPYVLHPLISHYTNNNGEIPYPMSFIDGKTVVVYMPYSASYKLSGSLYVLRISNNTLYRTRNPKGFTHMKYWDGKSVDTSDLTNIGSLIKI